MNILKKILSPLLRQKKSLYIVLFRGMLLGIFGIVVWLGVKYMIDALEKWNRSWFIFALSVTWCFFVIRDASWYIARLYGFKLRNFMQWRLYQQYLHTFFEADNNAIENLGTWRSNNIIYKWIDNWIWIIERVPQHLVAMSIGILSGLFLVAYNLGLLWFIVVLSGFCISFVCGWYGNKKVTLARREKRDIYIETDRSIVRMLMSKFEVLQQGKQYYEKEKLWTYFERIFVVYAKECRGMILSFDLQRIIIDILRVWVMLYVWRWVLEWVYTLWDMALLRMILNMIAMSMEDLNDYITDVHQRRIYVSKLRSTFEKIEPVKFYDTGKDFIFQKWDIHLDAVSFAYDAKDEKSNEVVSNFSLHISWWKKTAFIGLSGSWKTTLIKLISGYLHPSSGDIKVDGQSIAGEVSLKSYYWSIGYLTQEPNIFDGTILENLLYGYKWDGEEIDHSDRVDESKPYFKKIADALTLAKCEFVFWLSHGLQTEIWEKWVRLSWWQRQRLAIAKIFLKNPEIILLDEPTSALDSFAEQDITEAMENLFQGRTVIIIAHRLQTVKSADDIIVLENGEVIERGTHDQLVEKWWTYAKMLELQSGF